MSSAHIQRRLAAILAADVVGFSRMMEIDEVGTVAALKERRKSVLEPLTAQHRGRIFKVTGDGVLVSPALSMRCNAPLIFSAIWPRPISAILKIATLCSASG